MTHNEFCGKVVRRVCFFVIRVLNEVRVVFRRHFGRESFRRRRLRQTGPKVSVVIPVYNGSDFLAEAIESALRQTYQNVEIIIVNDGSNDDGATVEIISRYGDRVIAVEKENGGCASALNVGIIRATGEYISWLSHDDLYEETKIEDQMLMAVGYGNDKRIIFSDFSAITGEGKFKGNFVMPPVREEGFRYWLTEENCIHGCTLLVPRTAFEVHGGFEPELRTTHDYEKWFQFASDYEFCYQPGLLVKSRIHDQQCSVRMRNIVESEINDLLGSFCRRLDDWELEAAGKGNVKDGLLRLKKSFERRGFEGAAKEVDSILIERNLK
jgi:glycosyltransferase involved in cell wall biosynthesis